MRKSEIFDIALSIVSDEMEVSKNEITSNVQTIEVVDARHVLINILHKRGIYVKQIADYLNCSTRAVNYAITNFENRQKFNPLLKNTYQYVTKQFLTKIN